MAGLFNHSGRGAVMLALGLLCAAAPALSASDAKRADFARSLCVAAELQALKSEIDPNFFVRLLWKESMFDPNAVSPKGAQGIAQFMPETAERRGLADPFEPMAAVAASAHYLSELKTTFGNLGLAAAAYNAGEARVEKWKAGKSGMPYETQDYVAFITGKEVEAWKDAGANHAIPAVGSLPTVVENCLRLAMRLDTPKQTGVRTAKRMPWGAMVAAHFRQDQALGMFRRLKVRFPSEFAGRDPMVVRKRNFSRGSRALALVMLGAPSRGEAERICAKLQAAGAPCVVRKGR